jgi:lipopolysaccharide/colanic/teichoic acid biosynthesis glycosyltransferase
MAKRIVDVAAAAMGLAVLSPLFVFWALAIRLTSAGAVLHRARRAGLLSAGGE